jgi:hypothetical protein
MYAGWRERLEAKQKRARGLKVSIRAKLPPAHDFVAKDGVAICSRCSYIKGSYGRWRPCGGESHG